MRDEEKRKAEEQKKTEEKKKDEEKRKYEEKRRNEERRRNGERRKDLEKKKDEEKKTAGVLKSIRSLFDDSEDEEENDNDPTPISRSLPYTTTLPTIRVRSDTDLKMRVAGPGLESRNSKVISLLRIQTFSLVSLDFLISTKLSEVEENQADLQYSQEHHLPCSISRDTEIQ